MVTETEAVESENRLDYLTCDWFHLHLKINSVNHRFAAIILYILAGHLLVKRKWFIVLAS